MENFNYEDYDINDNKENVNTLHDLIELVKLVQDNPLLWNKTHPDFKNRDKKELKWTLLGISLTNNLSGDEAKKRFNNLRTTFGKLHKKVCDSEPRSGSGGNYELFKPDWPLYEHMQFLEDVIRPRRSKTSGVRKIQENIMQPTRNYIKRRKIMPNAVQPIFNSASSTHSFVQPLTDICKDENNINTSQCLPSEKPIVIAEGIFPEPCNLESQFSDNLDSYTETTDTEFDNVVTPPSDKSYKKKNDDVLIKNIGEVVDVLKSLKSNCSTKAPVIQSQSSSSDHVLSPTAEALLAFVKASLNKVKEENLINCFQDILNLFQKYTEK